MEIHYRNATDKDLHFLVESRLAFIEMTGDEKEYNFMRNNICEYFRYAIEEKQCDIVLAEYMDTVVGTGIVFYYQSVPSRFNPWGKNAYITSMYVAKKYRRQGIAGQILSRLLNLAKEKGYHIFFLHESEVGRPLYQKFGFTKGKEGMMLKMQPSVDTRVPQVVET